MILVLFPFIALSIGHDSIPILDTFCSDDHQVYNWSEYQCVTCPNDMVNVDNVCRPNSTYKYLDDYVNMTYTTVCSQGKTNFGHGLVCFPETFSINQSIVDMRNKFKATYYDITTGVNSPKISGTFELTDEFVEQYVWAEIYHSIDISNQTAVGFLSNACSVFNYDISLYPCEQFQLNYTSRISGNKYGYRFWPAQGPFITYGNNNPLSYVLEEDYISSTYNFGQIVNFQLARFSKYGDFKGFTPLTIDFQKCGDSNDIIELWKQFGYNYYSECFVDLNELVTGDSTDLFDAFIEDGAVNGIPVLRPVPVFLKNYRGIRGEAVNRGKSEANYRAVRRFFVNDNYTSNQIVQHMTNFSITFNLKTDRSKQILPPLFTIEYDQVYRSDLETSDFVVKIDEESVTHPTYSFSVLYVMQMNGFWNALTIVFSISVALGFVYICFKLFMFLRTHATDGANFSFIMGVLGYIFDIVGTVLFVVAFAFAVYVFIFFKFQSAVFICLPPEEDFKILVPILWTTLALKFVGMVFLIIMKSSTNVFIIDWENPKEKDIPVSSWRRIMVANEWNRILTVRQYSMPFTVLTMAFIIGGFNLNLLSTPIPSTKLIDMDKEYLILRFAFTSFVWLLLVLVEFIWCRFIFWPLFGNPFLNFVDLCSTSNISVLIRMSSFQGYYIHGRNTHGRADEELNELRKQLDAEKKGQAQHRGILPDTPNQVFQTFFAPEFRHQLNDLYDSQLAQTGAPSVLSIRPHVAGDIPHAAYETNQEVNDFLRDFFSKKSTDHSFVIQPESCSQELINSAPTVIEESVLTIVKDWMYKNALIGGIEWRLQLFYLVIFVCIGIPTNSPSISAIVVFIVDVIIVKIFNMMGRANLSKKSLLDDRFFL
ncbi:hypothetical protein TRFO_05677 [Tritrichomonas foetus]|uniref:Meckelin n=1 Tax=Tritrichomonas foetus TaxID=1144522 RepID=A0A1J4K8K0_9EUKA|nr:hypothetical protein TRFO_05677 [Tritrichomonas foetus]|eukprot:OHT06036.1 hypothetical protein TRFO_05677 [Tritrichomonas foetus]